MAEAEESATTRAEAVVSAFGAAWAAHDLEAALAMVSDDCLFDATGPAPDGTSCVGKQALADAWRAIFDDPTSTFEVEETFATEHRVTQRWLYRWGDGHVRGVDIYLLRDGLVAEKRSYVKG